jgi:hypothetical protein
MEYAVIPKMFRGIATHVSTAEQMTQRESPALCVQVLTLLC